MSVKSEIDRINENIENSYEAARQLGATMPEVMNSNNLANTISTISTVKDVKVDNVSVVDENGVANINGKEDSSNKVTTISSSPSDVSYPSEKAVKEYVDSNSVEVIAYSFTEPANAKFWWELEVFEGLAFTAQTAGSTIGFTKINSTATDLMYSLDEGITWDSWDLGTTETITLANVDDKIMFKGSMTSASVDDYTKFKMTGSIAASGSIMSILCNDPQALTLPCERCCFDMFQQCTSLTTPPELPAIGLTANCYINMFNGCSALTQVPELPATTLTDGCYYGMFDGCSALTTIPQNFLPAMTLANECYSGMFQSCSSLTTLPENLLPAMTLADGCYKFMFSMSGLVTLPANLLPATTLANNCYANMFMLCNSLLYLPKLPALVLKYNCYGGMFSNNFRIKLSRDSSSTYPNSYRIPYSGSGTTASNAMNAMFQGTMGTFASTPQINTTYYTSNQVV